MTKVWSADGRDSAAGLVEVLDYVRRHGTSTRSALAEATGLSRVSVAQRLAALLDRELLAEGDLARSTGGRAPRTLRFRGEAGYLLVADIGATSIDVAVADLSGTILAQAAEPADIADGPDVILSRAEELFEDCRAVAGRAVAAPLAGELWGIGIGVPGPVEFESGRPVTPPIMPGWNGYPVRERFAHHGVPVWVDNDANVMALGEHTAGLGRGTENFVYVKIGTGIGAGLIVRGKLHRGTQGCAGDIGHIQVPVAGRDVLCRCGNIDCLEALAGGAALQRDAEDAARDGRSSFLRAALDENGSLDASDVARAAAHGDVTSVELFASAGRHVGGVVAGIVNFFNPSLIVIGGGGARAGDHLLASIRETVYRRSLPLATRNLVIHRSQLGGQEGVIGAAAMVTNELFAPDFLARWLDAGTPVGQAHAAQV
jgi:glucokinase-like ROK family protein